jgi:hypothetical protein
LFNYKTNEWVMIFPSNSLYIFLWISFRIIEVQNDSQLEEKYENLFELNRKMKIENPVLSPNCENFSKKKIRGL